MAASIQFSNSPKEYWHLCASKFREEYKLSKIQEKISEINKTVGSHSFEWRAGPLKQTPAHVAVANDNLEAFKAFRAQGVWLTRKDANGKSVSDYIKAKGDKSETWDKVYLYSRIPNPVGASVLQKFMKEQAVALDQEPCTYSQNTDGFGVSIKKLLISNFSKGVNGHAIVQMILVCKYLGITLNHSMNGYYPRDYWFRLPSGIVKPPLIDAKIRDYAHKASSKSLTFAQGGDSLHPLPSLSGELGKVGDSPEIYKFDLENFFSSKEKPISYYGEGGNQFVIKNKNNEKFVLIARIQIDISHLMLRKSEEFKEKAVKTEIKPATWGKIEKTLKKMYAQGLLKIDKKDGLISREKIVLFMREINKERYKKWPELKDVPSLFQKIAEHISPKITDLPAEEALNTAMKYLRQKQLVREMIADTYNCPVGNVISLGSIFFHLDMFMLPGPMHSVLLVDFNLTVKLLEYLKDNAKLWDLSSKDIELLDVYIASAKGFAERLHPLIEKIHKRLDKAHIKWVPTPGLFYYDDQSKYELDKPQTEFLNVNFMNAVTGYSEKTNRHFYVVGGAKVGDDLGSLLMDAFTVFIQTYVPETDVIFVGHNFYDPANFSEPMTMSSDLDIQAGLHCMTFPLETKTHITKV